MSWRAGWIRRASWIARRRRWCRRRLVRNRNELGQPEAGGNRAAALKDQLLLVTTVVEIGFQQEGGGLSGYVGGGDGIIASEVFSAGEISNLKAPALAAAM